MATLIPAFSSRSQYMTPGERRLAQRLEQKLEDDYLLWYDVPVGEKRLHPDFILLHPLRGLIVLEVKDWKLDTIGQINPVSVTLLTVNGEERVKNPVAQARGYALAVKQELERDHLLVESAGHYKGKLAFPVSHGVILANITRKQFESVEGLNEVLEPNLVICQDEMYESVDAGEFQQRLWNFCTYKFGEPLTPTQIDRIRWHLFPEVRISDRPLERETSQPEALAVPDVLRVMDLYQEQLARSLGDGHRVVHGVAGSGKTLILVYRCLHLAQQSGKPILVLCFNVTLAAKLRSMLHEKGVGDRVTVRHFHGWCGDLLQQYGMAKPSYNQFQGDEYVRELVRRVIGAVDSGKIPAGQYGAVLIDEGHDFRPEWLKLTAQMVDPKTSSFLLLYDDAQNLYGEKRAKKFSFKSCGIQAQGRTTIFKINYRNTAEVLTVAYQFAREAMLPTDGQEEDTPMLVKPESSMRHGAKPVLIRLPNFKQEIDYLAERSQQFHERGTPWNEMAIVYRSKFMGDRICSQLKQAQIPVEWVNENGNSRDFKPTEQSIKLITMHSSKGLEFPVVFIPGVGYLPSQYSTPEEEARLLYVAMTRAIDQLVLTCDRDSEFVKRVEVALQAV
ncbi:NERD domain-containing protein [Leptolyngbya sp. FACHB-541]|uniref:DEAD/DEAH box helicase n=1 Tax=Leptolyngbya sp. FACHB-541 TaxID=2692810 RepID=UPI00168A1B71|nr:3'-5' exonuclease [Leptolyngbya sp. FACHB-541]MBD1998452.1 NERD domain-containing protein [Leptolyngbya sp. FACHB-541]